MKTSVLSFDYFLTSTDGDCMAVDDVLVLCLTSGLSFHLLLGYLPLFLYKFKFPAQMEIEGDFNKQSWQR